MQLIKKQMPDSFNLYMFGDNHEGAASRHREGFAAMRETILSDPFGYCIDMGDQIEGICVDDPRYDVEANETPPLKQCENVVKDYLPLKDRFICILDGNHTTKLHKFGNVTRDVICAGLFGASRYEKYGTYSAKISFMSKKGLMFKAFISHGFGSISSTADDPIRQESNMKLALKRKLSKKAGDCVLFGMGHTHKLLVSEPSQRLYLVDDGKAIKQRYTSAWQHAPFIPAEHAWFVNTGSFMKLYELGLSGYAERFGYDPVELGFIKATIQDRQIVKVEKVVL